MLDTSGVMSLVASRNARSKVSYDKIIHSSDQSDYVGLPANACDYVTSIGMWLGSPDSSGVFPVMKTYYWTQSGPADQPQFGSFGSNPALVHINNDSASDMVTFTPPNDGHTYSVSIFPPFPTEIAQFCDACSGGEVFVMAPPPVLVSIRTAYWGPPVTVNPTNDLCHWGTLACSAGTAPTCNGGFGIVFALTCPDYVRADWLVINGVCLVAAVTPASGPGLCN